MIKVNTLYGLENISDCYYISNDLQIYNSHGGRKTQSLGKRGYLYVSLNEKHTNRQVKVPVHKIVALAFIRNAPYEVINHIDGDKQNNEVDNLEFCTHQHNTIHAWEQGLIVRSERVFKVLFSDKSSLLGTMKELSVESGIPRATLYDLFYKRKGSEKHCVYKIVEVTDNEGQETIEKVSSA